MQNTRELGANDNKTGNKADNLIKRAIAYTADIYFLMLAFQPIFMVIGFNNLDAYYEVVSLSGAMIFICVQEIIFRKTLFKKLLKLEINSENNSENKVPVSIVHIIIRNICRILGPVDLICAVFDKKNRRLGDILGKTIVVNKL